MMTGLRIRSDGTVTLNSISVSGNHGNGLEIVGFQDDQVVPNDIDVDFGPWIGLGVSASF